MALSATSSPTGINLIADLTIESGVGESARVTLNAMLQGGIPVSCIDFRYGFDRRTDDAAYRHLMHGSAYDVNLMFHNPQEFTELSDERLREVTQDKYTIAYWVWELLRFPEQLREQTSRVDEIWTASRFCQQAIRSASNVPVAVIPHPIEVSTSPSPQRSAFGIPDDRYTFLFSFSATSFDARKNPFGYIEAFRRAFGHRSSGPMLVLKVHHLDLFPALRADLQAAVDEVGGLLLEGSYTREEMNDLLAVTDAYVSLHRAEGFGLGMAEAMYLGKPVIATFYSANVDYMNSLNSYPLSYTLRPLHAEDFRYHPDLRNRFADGELWAEADVDQAAFYMRRLVERPEEGRQKGLQAAQDIRAYCGPPVIARLIEDRLTDIRGWPAAARRRHDHLSVDALKMTPLPPLEVTRTDAFAARLRDALRTAENAYHEWDELRLRDRDRPFSRFMWHVPVLGYLYRTLYRVRNLGHLLAAQMKVYRALLDVQDAVLPELRGYDHSLEAFQEQVNAAHAQNDQRLAELVDGLQQQLTRTGQVHDERVESLTRDQRDAYIELSQRTRRLRSELTDQGEQIAAEGRQQLQALDERLAVVTEALSLRASDALTLAEALQQENADRRLEVAGLRDDLEATKALVAQLRQELDAVRLEQAALSGGLNSSRNTVEARLRDAQSETRAVGLGLQRIIEETQSRWEGRLAELQAESGAFQGQTAEAFARLEQDLARLRADLDQKTSEDAESRLRALMGAKGVTLPTPAAWVSGLLHGKLVAFIRRIECDLLGFSGTETADLTLQDGRADQLMAELVDYLQGRRQIVAPTIWYHVDPTPDYARALLFSNALSKVADAGYFALITDLGFAPPTETPGFVLEKRVEAQELHLALYLFRKMA